MKSAGSLLKAFRTTVVYIKNYIKMNVVSYSEKFSVK